MAEEKPRTKKAPKKEIPDNPKERERKVNLDSLLPSQLEEMSIALGEKCSEIILKAKADCDRILNVYGLKLRPYTLIVPLDYPDEDVE